MGGGNRNVSTAMEKKHLGKICGCIEDLLDIFLTSLEGQTGQDDLCCESAMFDTPSPEKPLQ